MKTWCGNCRQVVTTDPETERCPLCGARPQPRPIVTGVPTVEEAEAVLDGQKEFLVPSDLAEVRAAAEVFSNVMTKRRAQEADRGSPGPEQLGLPI